MEILVHCLNCTPSHRGTINKRIDKCVCTTAVQLFSSCPLLGLPQSIANAAVLPILHETCEIVVVVVVVGAKERRTWFDLPRFQHLEIDLER